MRAVYRFPPFELHPDTGELFRDGHPVRLQPQPLQILSALLQRPGELVTRQELASLLWGENTYSDVEQGLNIAVKKLRDGLGDSATEPNFIETLPRRGYRFIAPVSRDALADAPVAAAPLPAWRYGVLITSLILFVATTIGWWFLARSGKSLPFRQRDLVLVSAFQNQTGEPEMEGILEVALEAELTASPYVSVVPRERVDDALRLMRQPIGVRVPLPLARSVCLRDPAIRAVLTGGVRKVGGGYFLSAELVRPSDGDSIITLTETAPSASAFLPAVHRLSASIRRILGEPIPGNGSGGVALEPVTTSSLDALRDYSAAEALGREGQWSAAEVLLRRALDEDPRFASARILLAWALYNQRRPATAYLPLAEAALSEANGASPREALFIRGSFYSLHHRYAEAIPFYEALFQQFPEHPWVVRNLTFSYRQTRQLSRLEAMDDLLLQRRPNDPASHWRSAGRALCEPDARAGEVLERVDRAVELTRQQGNSHNIERARFRQMIHRALAAWAGGDARLAREHLDGLAGEALSAHPGIALDLAAGYLTIGQLERAGGLFERIPEAAIRYRWAIWPRLFAGDRAAVRRLLPAQEKIPAHPLVVLSHLEAGDAPAAGRMMRRILPDPMRTHDDAIHIAEAGLLLNSGHDAEAIETLTPALASISTGLCEHLLGAELLAKAYTRSGRKADAIAVLTQATSVPRGCGGFLRAAFWPRARLALMQLHGKGPEADRIRAELDALLAFADKDHPFRMVR
jgi:DNA-binding winged helix-turn-helix (wHTH) protein/tetratricopeptide (TPR) repeat protein